MDKKAIFQNDLKQRSFFSRNFDIYGEWTKNDSFKMISKRHRFPRNDDIFENMGKNDIPNDLKITKFSSKY